MGRAHPIGILLFALATVARGVQPASDPLQQRCEDVRALIGAENPTYEQLFSARFLDRVIPVQLTAIFQQYHDEYGPVERVRTVETTSRYSGRFQMITTQGYGYTMRLTVAPQPPHRVEGLRLGPASPVADTFDDVVGSLRDLHGRTSLLITREDGERTPLLSHRPDAAMAIGSTCKLYVLAELVRTINAGGRAWSDTVALEPEAISLPTGILQAWPPGTPLTLRSLATLMISESDHTATDQLLRELGRDRVEAVQEITGHTAPHLNRPFLTTLEMSKLKDHDDLAARYIGADTSEQRSLLAAPVAGVDRETLLPSYTAPRHIERIEWFASASDLSRALWWLRDETTDEKPAAAARAILSVNRGLDLPKGRWPYVAFKGGSEPGVLNLSLLLRDAHGRWYTVIVTWNDAEETVDQGQLVGLVDRALQLLAAKWEMTNGGNDQ